MRTSDNVKLILDGTIFWKVLDVSKMTFATADPPGDIHQKARNALIQAVSNETLTNFMANFNDIVIAAFKRDAQESFYSSRGVALESMELTRYDCVDKETARILQDIIAETTKKLNDLTAQQSKNEVEAARIKGEIELEKSRAAVESAKLQAQIDLEKSKTELIRTKEGNEGLKAKMKGEATGMQLVRSAATFIQGLNETVPNVESRVQLYRLHNELEGRNRDTQNLASGKAKLFLTPKDLNLRIDAASEL